MMCNKVNRYKFTATLVPRGKELSTLKANVGGVCNDVATQPGSQGCGLSKYLMKACYEDDGILGVGGKGYDAEKDCKGIWPDESSDVAEKANTYCEKMVYTKCAPDESTPNRACVSYLRAAKSAKFDIVFVSNNDMSVFNLNVVTAKFESSVENADKFIEKYGADWFFCKCKDEFKKECFALHLGARPE